MRYQKLIRGVGLAASVIAAGCATQPTETPKQTVAAVQPAPQPARQAPIAVKLAPVPTSSARTVDVYKQHVAEKIAAANSSSLADTLPPILKSVVVLEISVDREGNPIDVSVRRSNGFKDLEQAAIASVRRTGRFPAPSSDVLGGHASVTYLETFLFRPDGRYQIRSLAPVPARTGPVATKN